MYVRTDIIDGCAVSKLVQLGPGETPPSWGGEARVWSYVVSTDSRVLVRVRRIPVMRFKVDSGRAYSVECTSAENGCRTPKDLATLVQLATCTDLCLNYILCMCVCVCACACACVCVCVCVGNPRTSSNQGIGILTTVLLQQGSTAV